MNDSSNKYDWAYLVAMGLFIAVGVLSIWKKDLSQAALYFSLGPAIGGSVKKPTRWMQIAALLSVLVAIGFWVYIFVQK